MCSWYFLWSGFSSPPRSAVLSYEYLAISIPSIIGLAWDGAHLGIILMKLSSIPSAVDLPRISHQTSGVVDSRLEK